MPIQYVDWVERSMLRASPDTWFVFGDNAERIGMGGQAGAMRGEPNAIGVATLHAPGRPYGPDDARALFFLSADLTRVAGLLARDALVMVPRDGIGTGIAALPQRAPHLHRLIVAFFRAAPGEPCPWKD